MYERTISRTGEVKNIISTMERDFVVKDGVATFPMKELPNWYGLSDVGFIWHGEWSDPEIEYKGKRINATIVEDAMWERWIRDDDGFKKFMLANANEVYGLIELATESEK